MIPPWTRPWLLAWVFVALCAVFTADLWVPGRERVREIPAPLAPSSGAVTPGAGGRVPPSTASRGATAVPAPLPPPPPNPSASSTRPAPAPPALGSTCGDGKLDPGEACDDGGESRSCNSNCTPVLCGDGILSVSAKEQCDDGGTRDEDGCSRDCKSECGNGRRDDHEECDDGGESPSCNRDCTRARCGDGVLNKSAGEVCDDGNAVPGDGCGPDCRPEDRTSLPVPLSSGSSFAWMRQVALERARG